jgi:hypothetical protein
MYRTTRRYGLQSTLFTANPWVLVQEALREKCSSQAQAEAAASVQQARSLFEAGASASLVAAKPLLYYYSFMNLAKAYALLKAVRKNFDQAYHGLRLQGCVSSAGLASYWLDAYPSPGPKGKLNLFDDLLLSLRGTGLAVETRFDLGAIMPQILVGHRVWAVPTQRRERFLAVDRISMLQSTEAKEIWLDLEIFADDLARLGVSRSRLLSEAQLDSEFSEVTNQCASSTARRVLCFQQNAPLAYTSRPSDVIPDLVDGIRQRLWAIVQSIPPYRKYYVYLCPQPESPQLLPQLAAPYALMYALSSITRYRPQEFDQLLEGKDGPFIQEFLTSQPRQLLYLLTSSFAKRDVTLPAVV